MLTTVDTVDEIMESFGYERAVAENIMVLVQNHQIIGEIIKLRKVSYNVHQQKCRFI